MIHSVIVLLIVKTFNSRTFQRCNLLLTIHAQYCCFL
uniref:Uncharacterized protein n=1 Tax=Anguilla anguilla TaxID=7936 RepID=A0A0E9VNW4_ANGAN